MSFSINKSSERSNIDFSNVSIVSTSTSSMSDAQTVEFSTEVSPKPMELVQTSKTLEIVKSSWENVLSNPHTLLVASDEEKVNGLKIGLQRYCSNHEKKFVYLDLSYPGKLPSLQVAAQVLNERILRNPGPWLEVMQNGGVVFLNYDRANSQLVECLNSLFDTPQRFNGSKIHPDVRIVGAMSEGKVVASPSDYTNAVYRRWSSKGIAADNLSRPDPILAMKTIPYEASAGMQVFDGLDPSKSLVGKLKLTPFGGVIAVKGELIHVLEQIRDLKSDQKHLVLKNCDWQDEDFIQLLHILLTGKRKFKFNNEEFTIPKDFVFYRCDEPKEVLDQVCDSQSFLPISANESNRPVLVVNPNTFSKLFVQTSIIDPKVVEEPGLIAKYPQRALFVTEDLSERQWRQLVKYAQGAEVFINPSVTIPAFILERHPQLKSGIATGEQKKESSFSLPLSLESSSLIIRSTDPEATLESINAYMPTYALNITPDMDVSQLIDSAHPLSKDTTSATEMPGYEHINKHLLKKLKTANGEAVVFLGLSRNPKLARELSTLFLPHPYLIVNGEIVEISVKVMAIESGKTLKLPTHQISPVTVDEAKYDLFALLQRDYPEYKKEDHDALMAIFDMLNRLPAPPQKGIYPSINQPTFAKVKHLVDLMQYMPLERVIKDYLFEEYREDKEVYAYLKVYLKHLNTKPTFSAKLKDMNAILQAMKPEEEIEQVAWQLLNCLSPAVIKKIFPTKPSFLLNKEACVSLKGLVAALLGKGKPDFLLTVDISEKSYKKITNKFFAGVQWTRDSTPHHPSSTDKKWTRLLQKAEEGLKHHNLILLQGPSGAGKSFITKTIVNNFHGKEIAKLTIGAHTHFSEIEKAIKRAMDDDYPGNKFIIVDEATLAKKGFWKFFKDYPYVQIGDEIVKVPSNIKFILTSNQNSMEGRKPHPVLLEKGRKLFFSEFSDEFIYEKILKEMLEKNFGQNTSGIARAIFWLKDLFAILQPKRVFTPRDYEQIAVRLIRNSTKFGFTSDIVVQSVKEEFFFDLQPEQQKAFNDFLSSVEGYYPQFIQSDPSFEKLIQGILKKGNFSFTPALLSIAYQIYSAFDIRERRLSGNEKTGNEQKGKFAFEIRGVTGAGKDTIVRLIAEAYGFVDGFDPANVYVDPHKKFYHINADMGVSLEKLDTILHALAHGSFVCLSEANLLPSDILETLNSALNGDVNPATLSALTINPKEGYVGRKAFSEAFENRFTHYSMPNPSRSDLMQIMAEQFKDVPLQIQTKLLNYHLTLKEKLEAQQSTLSPGLSEILLVLSNVSKGYSLESSLKEAYLIQHKVLGTDSIQSKDFSTLEDFDQKLYAKSFSQLLCGRSSIQNGMRVEECALLKFSRAEPSSSFLQRLERIRTLKMLQKEHKKSLVIASEPPQVIKQMREVVYNLENFIRFLKNVSPKHLSRELIIGYLEGVVTENDLFFLKQFYLPIPAKVRQVVDSLPLLLRDFEKMCIAPPPGEWNLRMHNTQVQNGLMKIKQRISRLFSVPEPSLPEVQTTKTNQIASQKPKTALASEGLSDSKQALLQLPKGEYDGEKTYLFNARYCYNAQGVPIPLSSNPGLKQRAPLPERVNSITLQGPKANGQDARGYSLFDLLLPEYAIPRNVVVHSDSVLDTQLIEYVDAYSLAVKLSNPDEMIDISYDVVHLTPGLSKEEVQNVYAQHQPTNVPLELPSDLNTLIQSLQISSSMAPERKREAINVIKTWFKENFIYSCDPQYTKNYQGTYHNAIQIATVLFKSRRGVCRHFCIVFGYLIKSLFQVPVQYASVFKANEEIQGTSHAITGVFLNDAHQRWEYFDATPSNQDEYTREAIGEPEEISRDFFLNLTLPEVKISREKIDSVEGKAYYFDHSPLTDIEQQIYRQIKVEFAPDWFDSRSVVNKVFTERPGDFDVNQYVVDPLHSWANFAIKTDQVKRRVMVLDLSQKLTPHDKEDNRLLRLFWKCFFDNGLTLHVLSEEESETKLLEVKSLEAFERNCLGERYYYRTIDEVQDSTTPIANYRKQIKENLLQLVRQNKWNYIDGHQQDLWSTKLHAIHARCTPQKAQNLSQVQTKPTLEIWLGNVDEVPVNLPTAESIDIRVYSREECSTAYDTAIETLKAINLKPVKELSLRRGSNELDYRGGFYSDKIMELCAILKNAAPQLRKLNIDTYLGGEIPQINEISQFTESLTLGIRLIDADIQGLETLAISEIRDTTNEETEEIKEDEESLPNIEHYTKIYNILSTFHSLQTFETHCNFLETDEVSKNPKCVNKMFEELAKLSVSKLVFRYPHMDVNANIATALKTGLKNLKELHIIGCSPNESKVKLLTEAIRSAGRPDLKVMLLCGDPCEEDFSPRIIEL